MLHLSRDVWSFTGWRNSKMLAQVSHGRVAGHSATISCNSLGVDRHAPAVFGHVACRARGPKRQRTAAVYTRLFAQWKVFSAQRRRSLSQTCFVAARLGSCSLCNSNSVQLPLRSNWLSLMLRCAQATASMSHPEAHTQILWAAAFPFPNITALSWEHCFLFFCVCFFFSFNLKLVLQLNLFSVIFFYGAGTNN